MKVINLIANRLIPLQDYLIIFRRETNEYSNLHFLYGESIFFNEISLFCKII